MYQRLFAVKYNGKKFLLFKNVKDSHIAFLEWKENGDITYPEYIDYVALNNIYNNHDYSIVAAEKFNLKEKIRLKETVLTVLIEGAILVGAVAAVTPILDEIHQSVIIRTQQAQSITDREAISLYFGDTITKEDVIEVINNNPNIEDKYKAKAREMLDTFLELDPNMDLRIYYENMRQLQIKVVDNKTDPEYKDMSYCEGWFSAKEHTIYLNKNFTGYIGHELSHAAHVLYLKTDKTTFELYDTQGSSLAEAMTEIITNKGFRGDTLVYSDQKRLLCYLWDSVDNFDIHTYNEKGISALIDELKEKYPNVDIDYIISYMDTWTYSRNNKGIQDLDMYNFKEYLDELFEIAKANTPEKEPYKGFKLFIKMAKNYLRPDYAENYLKEYNLLLESKGLSTEESAEIDKLIQNNTSYKGVADEEKEEFLKEKFQHALENITPENAYGSFYKFIYMIKQTDYYSSELEQEYLKRYDQEVINKGILTAEQINQVREITSFIKTKDGILLACTEHDLSYSVRQDRYFEVFNYGRFYETDIINEQGELENIKINDEAFKLHRVWFDSNQLLNFIAQHQGTPLGDITKEETKQAIAEQYNYFDEKLVFNRLENGEELFTEVTPDLFVELGITENGQLGFQLIKGDEVLYRSKHPYPTTESNPIYKEFDHFKSPTSKIPYSVYPHFNDRLLGEELSTHDSAIETLLSTEYLDKASETPLLYFAPNMHRYDNPEYNRTSNNKVDRYIYEFEEPIKVIIDGKEYTQSDVYFYFDFDKGYEAIDENVMLHIPEEKDVLIGEIHDLDMPFINFNNLEDIYHEMGIPIPENREIVFTKPELKEFLRHYIEKDYEIGQKK